MAARKPRAAGAPLAFAPWALAQAIHDYESDQWDRTTCPACFGPLVEFRVDLPRVRACGTPGCPIVFAQPTSGAAV